MEGIMFPAIHNIGKSEKSDADAVLQVSMSANYELFEKVRRDNTMCEALRRLMKDEIEQELAKEFDYTDRHLRKIIFETMGK